jgi:hypothetical protein
MKILRAALLALSLSFSLLPNTALAGYAEGYAAYKKQDFATALREFEPLASQGHAQSQFVIGLMYHNGQGVAKNDAEAVKWFRQAANQGNSTFQYYFGGVYDQGQGVAQDYKEAVKWYRLAANQGNANAQNDLGVMYAKGQGVAQDDKEAVKWYRLAANQGHAGAKTNVAYHEGRRKEQITESKRKAEEAVRMEEEVKRIQEETARNAEEAKLKAEEAARIEAEAKRIEEEARRKAEEAARIEEEAKRKAEEVKRLEEEAKRKAERNVRIVSWIAAAIGLLGVIAFYLRRRKKTSANLSLDNQRKATQAGTAGITATTENEQGGQQASGPHGLKRLWASALQDKFLTVVYPVMLVAMVILIRANNFDILDYNVSHTPREPLPSCGGGFIAQCIQKNGLDPRLEGDARFQSLYELCSSQCQHTVER